MRFSKIAFVQPLTIKSLGSTLLISGTPAGTTGLTITGTGGMYHITDGATNKGTFSADSITMSLTHYNESITFDLGTQTLGGNLLLSLGTGNLSKVALSNPVTIDDGTVGGSVTVLNGSVNETLSLGDAAGTHPLHVGDSVLDVAHNSSVGGNLFLSDNSFVGGALTVSGVPSVQMGTPSGTGATIGGSVSINASKAGPSLDVTLNGTTVIKGSLTVVGTAMSTGLGDSFDVAGGAAGVTVNGDVNVNLGNGVNLWQMGGTYAGNVTLTGGNGGNTGGFPENDINLNDVLGGSGGNSATIAGSLTVTTGSGSTEFLFPSTVDGATNNAAVSGNVSLNFGNGVNDLGGGAFGGLFDGTVSGNVNVVLGNGTNVGSIGVAPAGTLSWQSGNGSNTLTLGSTQTPTSTWDVALFFGTGTNTLNLAHTGNPPQFLTGLVVGSGGSDTFTQDTDWVLGPPLKFLNF